MCSGSDSRNEKAAVCASNDGDTEGALEFARGRMEHSLSVSAVDERRENTCMSRE